MRRNEQEIFDLSEIESIIRSAEVCSIGILGDKYPYIVPMNFGYSDKILYLHSGNKGKKIDMIKSNPYIGFHMNLTGGIIKDDLMCNWGISYKSIIGNGKATILDSFEDKQNALEIIMSQYTDDIEYNFHPKVICNTTVIKVEIDELTGKKSDDE